MNGHSTDWRLLEIAMRLSVLEEIIRDTTTSSILVYIVQYLYCRRYVCTWKVRSGFLENSGIATDTFVDRWLMTAVSMHRRTCHDSQFCSLFINCCLLCSIHICTSIYIQKYIFIMYSIYFIYIFIH